MSGSPAKENAMDFAHELYRLFKAEDGTAGPNKADVKFAEDMIEHHEMAVDMSEKVLRDGKDEWIAGLARGIISAQKKEIDDMRNWLRENKPAGSKPSGGGMNMD